VADAVHAMRQAWRLGFMSKDPDLNERPRMALADLN
jgi:hypothetical protein